ncbi:hypothetical protein QJS10_CPB18g01320 [Acorus calamus]|uniref:Uncharacterized protein n=1 Tax=Acorus calamus TaxID=4465 RepID=A0AAV9CN81_ACOCL|nr:hypothetical protein QJS10_CPB18g01320 [Acorus calamus]
MEKLRGVEPKGEHRRVELEVEQRPPVEPEGEEKQASMKLRALLQSLISLSKSKSNPLSTHSTLSHLH